jgi:hypothetical protein
MQKVLIAPASSTTTWLCSQTISGKRSAAIRSERTEAASMSSSVIRSKKRSITYRGMPKSYYRVCGKPRSTFDVAGSGQRDVTTLPRV